MRVSLSLNWVQCIALADQVSFCIEEINEKCNKFIKNEQIRPNIGDHYAGTKGENTFVHPTTKDLSFYPYEDIICQLEKPPTATNHRYMSLDERDFTKVLNEID